MPFTGDSGTHLIPNSVGASCDNLAAKLMPDDHRDGDRLLRPRIPLIDMHIGATDCGLADLDQNVIDIRFWNRDLLHPDAWLRLQLDESSHVAGHDCRP